MSLVRFSQIVAAIRIRKYLNSREENSRYSWLARQLATFIAQGYWVEGDNPAVEHAGKLSLDEVESVLLGGSTSEENSWKPGDPALVKEPKPGSFEKLMSVMGTKR